MIRYSVALWSHTVIFMTTEKYVNIGNTARQQSMPSHTHTHTHMHACAHIHTHTHTHTWEKKAGDIGTRLICTCLWLIYTTVLQSNGRHQLAGTAIYWYWNYLQLTAGLLSVNYSVCRLQDLVELTASLSYRVIQFQAN